MCMWIASWSRCRCRPPWWHGSTGGSTMSTMVEEVQLPNPYGPLRPGWTVADLASVPDDGMRYELIDGSLLVTPAPCLPHQRVVLGLAVVLRAACPASTETFIAPVDYQPDERNSLQPD